MSKTFKPIPALIPFEEIKPFIEKETEVTKATLISRIVGKVGYEILTIIKMYRFYAIYKDQDDNLSLL